MHTAGGRLGRKGFPVILLQHGLSPGALCQNQFFGEISIPCAAALLRMGTGKGFHLVHISWGFGSIGKTGEGSKTAPDRQCARSILSAMSRNDRNRRTVTRAFI